MSFIVDFLSRFLAHIFMLGTVITVTSPSLDPIASNSPSLLNATERVSPTASRLTNACNKMINLGQIDNRDKITPPVGSRSAAAQIPAPYRHRPWGGGDADVL